MSSLAIYPKPLVVGAPRSGFSLLIAVTTSILNLLQIRSRRPFREQYIQGMVTLGSLYVARQYYLAFEELNLLDRVVFNGEFHLLVGGPKWLDPLKPERASVRKYVGIKGLGDFLLVVQHPRELMEYYVVLHSHENPGLWLETPYYENFIKMASLRNPIGVINSSCFSLNAMASEYLQRFMPDQDEHVVRQRHGAYKLTDLTFVDGLIKYLTKFLDQYLKVRGRYFTLKWEDLINHPGPAIQSVGRALGLELNLQTAEQIWKPLDHKNLLQFHKHNYRQGKGIVGDWKNSLVNQHMDLFRQRGFDHYLKELGYPPIPELNPREYSPYQKLVSRFIERGEVFHNTGDPDLFGLAFNKSNIDAGKFNFRSLPKQNWTHVERTTIENDDIVLNISNRVEQAVDRFNQLFLWSEPGQWNGGLDPRRKLKTIADEMKKLFAECPSNQAASAYNQVFSGLDEKLRQLTAAGHGD